jgi:branched-chain amino acid transport system permease protein
VNLPGTDTGTGLLVVLSIFFAAAYLLVVAVRRSAFGQRLLAMKDSPAGAATLGMNLTTNKVIVFAFSAAMAGVGGALYGGTLGSVAPDQFAFFTSLPLLLLGVVGGIGSPAGALLGGVLVGAVPILVDIFPWYENISRLLPGTMGIALGRNPNGIIQELRVSFAPVGQNVNALVLTLGSVAVVLALRLAEVIDGGLFALLLILAILSGSLLLRVLEARGSAPTAHDPTESATVPLEWVGIDRPFTREDVAELDRELGLEAVR